LLVGNRERMSVGGQVECSPCWVLLLDSYIGDRIPGLA
jgi:hypothetical protein